MDESIDNAKANEYLYDFEDRLIQTQNDNETITYTYDGDGTLIKKTITTGATTETYEYLYDYTAGLPRLLVEKKNDGTTYDYLYAGGRLYGRKGPEGTVYYHQDGLGSTIAITDASGNILNKYDYAPFGEPQIIQETVENSLLFTGEPYDQSELLYLRARYYDPKTGRFVSKDKYKGEVTDPSSQNSYAYCGNNPVNYVDPSGNYIQLPITYITALGTSPDTSRDMMMLSESGAAFVENPNFWTGLAAGLDAGALIVPGVSAGGSKIAKGAKQTVSKVKDFFKGAGEATEDVIQITKDGVALPKGRNIPSDLIENPYRSGSYGRINPNTGKFEEILRIDPATLKGKKGPNYSHYHLNKGDEHFSPRPGDKDPWFEK
jgi:RHS repeat-associated protein